MNRLLQEIFKEALKSVRPGVLVRENIQCQNNTPQVMIGGHLFKQQDQFHIIGFGKAAYEMAKAAKEILGSRIVSGVLSIPNHNAPPIEGLKIFKGATNNLPDEMSVAATEEIISYASRIPQEEVALVLISGGGSSLLCKPVPGITLHEKLLTIKQLVSAGADITELNTVRRCLSVVKGGGLARILKNRSFISLILSDVINDPLSIIASGPTVMENEENRPSAMDVLKKYKLELKVPKPVLHLIRNQPIQATSLEGSVNNHVIGNNRIALESLLNSEQLLSCQKFLVSCAIQGDVEDVAQKYMVLAMEVLRFTQGSKTLQDLQAFLESHLNQWCIPNKLSDEISHISPDTDAVFLAMGGETTVKLKGKGKGGRNQELSLIFSKLCHDEKSNLPNLFEHWDVMLLSGGTDGIDGPTDAAGGIGCAEVIEAGLAMGLEVDEFLGNNDSYCYLSSVSNGEYLIKTGHTGTNVMDVHIIAIYKKSLNFKIS